ncbi:MAG TPA: hypothetical protein DD444_08745 [Citreicella sp.]|jgi:cytoskeletal protein RodZ|uniref:Uncharacterized protein n=1 Tax=Salipiger marinus TaxID=555512 RepID=A0A1G8RRZ2_9RHOB|nr:hypothetical protein [Salipiger marinus]SDJ19738.1 hypothetical protein SAMN04487993_102160 [Salipiger marinus]HBM59266.1 hypothetical protein [Citreicella sp.]HBT00587.1 hypothetical protein [Citreicella sp.]
MSAPDTNLDRQKRRHKGPLWGIWGGLAVVAVLFVIWLAYAMTDTTPETEPVADPATTEQSEVPAEDAPTVTGTETTPSDTEAGTGTPPAAD